MAKEISQILEQSNGDGTGTVTVITTDENGNQYAASRDYDNSWWSTAHDVKVEEATQESLNKR